MNLYLVKYRIRVVRDRIERSVAGDECNGVVRYNDDKPHRCPECHAVTDPEQLCKRAVVVCCQCDSRFTRWPRIQRFLPNLGVVCPEDHRKDRA